MFFLQPFEDPLRRVPLLPDLLLVLFQDPIDHSQKRFQLRPLYRLLYADTPAEPNTSASCAPSFRATPYGSMPPFTDPFYINCSSHCCI